jgi:alpha-methylacyl-CoA racemase
MEPFEWHRADWGRVHMSGPLSGTRVIEIAAIGPAPFCGMMLADHGAEVIVVHRPGGAPDPRDPLARSRQLLEIDLKSPHGASQVRDLVQSADALIEGFRPGVMERLGLGPDVLLADNPKLVYGRMTGWGQTGPLAQAAGHDINYIGLSGALHAFGRAECKPTAPLNMVGDFGGGGMMLAFGVLAALLHARQSGEGQVVDCAMTEGSSLLMSMIWGLRAQGQWQDKRGVNLLDSGAHFYDTYETADGEYVSIGAIEPKFYAELARIASIEQDSAWNDQMNPDQWPILKQRLTSLFKAKTRREWCSLMEGTDICFAPVLSMVDATQHAHNLHREAFLEVEGVVQPAPAPRYSRSALSKPRRPKPSATE